MDHIQNIDERLFAVESQLQSFFDRMDQYGLEWLRKYYGIYRAFVKRNDDPDKRGRIQIMSPDAGHRDDNFPQIWIDPMFAGAGTDRGSFAPPEVGDSVRVSFDRGDLGTPNGYWGGWHGLQELPEELAYSDSGFPERRGMVTRMGHAVYVVDEPGKEQIKIAWHKAAPGDPALTDRSASADRTSGDSSSVSFDPDGSVKIVDKSSNSVVMDDSGITVTDANGNSIFLGGGNNTLKLTGDFTINGSNANLNVSNINLGSAANFKAVLGEVMHFWLKSHAHPSAVGPTGTPIVPPPETMLSDTVKVQS
jgi:hypothetical protein